MRFLCAKYLLTTLSLAMPTGDGTEARKTSKEDIAVQVEKMTLDNGMVVLLSPDPGASSLLVDMSFRAGTIYEPPGLSGLAHFVEHVMVRGTTPDADYSSMLERRGAREVNAYTNAGFMTFRLIVPPEELPIALWVVTDRLATLPARLDARTFEHHRRIILEERNERSVDVPYGAVEMAINAHLFPAPHPLHGQVIGLPTELAKITLEDVRAFIDGHLTASNAVLTIVGNFDAATAKRLITETVDKLGSGARPPKIALPKKPPRGGKMKLVETLSRRPRVTVLWALDDLTEETRDALRFGALLLSNYVDGAFGTEVNAQLSEIEGEGYFRLDLTLPYEKPIDSAEREAEVFLRYLTAVDIPRDIFTATRLAHDRAAMFSLDTLTGRAAMITGLQYAFGDPTRAATYNARPWTFARHDVQHIAWKNLIMGPPRVVVHARPQNSRQAKLEFDER